LVKDLEAALIIVRTNAAAKLDLTLQKAEVEIAMTSKTSVVGGVKLDIGVSLDASTERERAQVHKLTVELNPKGAVGSAGAEETEDLAASILDVLSLHKKIGELNSDQFDVGALKLSVAFERTTSGKLQIVGGGGKSSALAQRVDLTFWQA
jgi:hypothetical protein